MGCKSFQTSVTVLQVHLFTWVLQHMFQGLLIIRSQLQRGISRSHDCEKMFQVFQTLTFAANNSTEAFATGSSASLHSDVTVRFFESDTRVIERARLRAHSTLGVWKFHSTSRRFHNGRHTQLTLESLDLALHGGKGDGTNLATFSHSD